MHPLTHLRTDSRDAVLRATRRSQAWVIAGVDRLARDVDDRPRPLGRLWRLQLDLAATLVGEPSGVVDEGYRHLEQLLALQREFGQRLLETVERPEPTPDASGTGRVIPFVRPAG